MCCLCCHEGGGHLYIRDKYNGKGVNWDEILSLKKKFIEDNKKGIIHSECVGCFNLVKRDWDDSEQYISWIHFNHWTHCNSNCIYCYTASDKPSYQKKSHYKVLPMIKELFKRKMYKPDGVISFAGGEPTILNEFEELVTFVLKNNPRLILVHSSGIKYSKAIERGIKEQKLIVCLSPDAGTKETYYKVKGVDKFNKFWENVKKYSNAQKNIEDKIYVRTKFIIIPGVNDNKYEIDKWLEKNIELGIKTIVVDIENHFCSDLRLKNLSKPQHLIELCKYIINRAKELDLNLIHYDNYTYFASDIDL